MRDTTAESLVNAGAQEGTAVITIRRSVLVAAAATAAILGVLVVWLIHSNAPSVASAAPPPARAADVSTIDEHLGRASDALVVPTSAPAPPPHPDPALLADTVPVAQPQAPAVIQQGQPTVDQGAIDRQREADDLARAHQ